MNKRIETIRNIEVYLIDKYGPVMDVMQVAEFLKCSRTTVQKIPDDALPRERNRGRKAKTRYLASDLAIHMYERVHGKPKEDLAMEDML